MNVSTSPQMLNAVRTTVQLPGQRPSSNNIFAGWGPKL
jgi:hypothetical protein